MENLQKRKFDYDVDLAVNTLPFLCGYGLDEFYLKPEICAESFMKGKEIARQIFGDRISIPGVSLPPLSYGHVSCLGSKVYFPKDSEPGVRPIYSSLGEGVEALKRKINFEDSEMYRHYVKIHNYLTREFPEQKIGFYGFTVEGPVTTAVLLRGQDFFMDIYDDPEMAKGFLAFITESIISFVCFLRKINGKPEIANDRGYIADDFAALIPPGKWPEFVLPYWEQYFQGTTSNDGKRNIHIENLIPDHLKYLEKVEISFYDPTVSPKLTPRIIRNNISIPFSWHLCSYHLVNMDIYSVREWVTGSFEEGTEKVWTSVENITCAKGNPEKIFSFIEAAEEIKLKL